ncbi:M16 family metallopeptidase [Pedobacter nutrimenti]|jgi:zinc protease|uniref:Zinc protease n=1 Tax=Pedobacter nutrimenti TaxID=1241337 RepID=A0A318UHL9_9SPHI|nr:M16 family metallopeptidase [Pedobacter nutrimenti]PYF75040.1 zinc protease [Pedobacter nutrimenti]
MIHHKHKIFLVALALGLCQYLPGQSQVKSAAPHVKNTKTQQNVDAALPLNPAVRTGKLANGFTYYIQKNKEPKDRVVLYLANKVGSILENDEQQGLAHFMEHMSFNGTKHFPKNELVNYLQKSGVRFGADINAYTSFDETVYQLPLPTDKPEILKNGLQIMRDWAQEASLDPEEINKERGVVLEEKRLGKGASERMQRQFLPMILNNSRYASRLPIGKEEVLLNFKPEAIKSYYKDWYRPNLQALIVVGDINVAEIEQMIRAKFSDLKNPLNEKVRTKYSIPLSGKNQFISVTDPEMTATVLQVMIKHREPELKTERDYRASLVRGLFNQMLSDRYTELSRQADPPFIQGGASISGLLGGLNSYGATVVAKPGELEKGFKALWRETRRVEKFGFTATELGRAKQNYLSSMEAALKERDKTPSENYVQEYLQYFLNQTAAPGIVKENELVVRLLPGISLPELNALSAEYIKDSNRDIVLMAPEKDKATLPDQAKVLGWLESVNQEPMEAFKDEVSKLPLLAVIPKAEKIFKVEKDDKLGLQILKLSNGATVLLKKTNFKNNQILFSAYAEGGSSLYTDADFQSANNAAGVVASGGVGNYNATQLDKFLSDKQVGLGPYIGDRSQGLSGSSTSKDLETAFKLIYGYFTEPRKDGDIFKGLIANAKAGLANRADDPGKVFSDTVNAVLGNYSIRRTGPSIEKIDQISLDRSFEIYKERFANASAFTFFFVGSIEEEKILPLIEKYLASLPANGAKTEAKDLNIHIPAGKITKTVYKGTEQKATVRLVFSGPYEYSYENNLKMDALKEVLEIRLLERLREQESGVYSPGASISVTKYPKERFSLTISFGCAPENTDRLIASAVDEINKLKNAGPLQQNIDKFKAEDKRSREVELKTNDFWLGYLVGQYANKEKLSQLDNYDAALNKITVSSLKETANKFIKDDNYIRLVLLPQQGQKAAGK